MFALAQFKAKQTLRKQILSVIKSDERKCPILLNVNTPFIFQRSSSDHEYERWSRGGGVRHRNRARSYGDGDTLGQMHEMHQSIRDLTSEQLRMGDDLNREIDERRR